MPPRKLSGHETYAASRRVLDAVERVSPHLTYAELVAAVEGTLPPGDRSRSERHLTQCARCRRERDDLALAAPALRIPVRRRDEEASWPRRAWAWLAGRDTDRRAHAWGIGAAATAVMAVAALAVAWKAGLAPVTLPVDAGTSARVEAGAALAHATFDRSVLDDLQAISPAVQAAYQANDIATLVRLLESQASAGNARAQAALGLLYAEGRSIAADPARAAHWWSLAAERNDAARRNLDVLRAREAAEAPAAPAR